MAWNEPGGGGGRDPWGGGDQQQGPPDLDEVLKKLQDKLSGIFGGDNKKGNGAGGGGGGKRNPLTSISLGLVVGLVLIVWFATGIFIVDQAEEAVVTRFGEYVRTEPPGPHWQPSLIEMREMLNVQQVRTEEIGFRTTGRTQGSVAH